MLVSKNLPAKQVINIMSDKKSEKDELMEKVFGKGSPNRSISGKDIEILNRASNSFNNELDELLKRSTVSNSQLDSLIDAANDIVKTNADIVKINNSNINDLEQLRQNIISDFGEKVLTDTNVSISFNQIDLYNKFTEAQNELDKNIVCQQDYNKQLCKAFRRPYVMGKQESGINGSLLISGNKNTGRHSSINLLTSLLAEKQILPNGKITFINLELYKGKEDENNFIIDLYSAINNSNVIAFENIESVSAAYLAYMEEILLQGKLSLNKRYVLNNKQLVETSTSLSKNTISQLSFLGKYLIYITTLKTNKLLNILGSRFINGLSDIISTSDFDSEEIGLLYENKLVSFKTKLLTCLNIELETDEEFVNYVKDKYDGSNAKYIEELLNKIYEGLSEYKLINPNDEKLNILISVNNDEILFNDNKLGDYLAKTSDNAIEEVNKELSNIVGLQSIKDYIFSLQDFYEAQKLKQAQGLQTSEISKHMIFTGNPGTGKTTIARLLAKYLKAIGVLSNGQLIEVSRNDLVGKYVGHTAPLTMQVINSAIGGVLFIDEAYSLYRGDNDSFGLECIDTLVKAMEDNRDNLIVILAGYTKEMKEFLNSNSGLQSRFPVQIEFPDYTGEELYEIAIINAKSAGYQIEDKAKDVLINYFNKVQENDSVRSGNGRLSRNLVEKAIIKQSTRILKDNGQLDLLLLDDFVLE